MVSHQLNYWNYYSDYFDGERKLFPQQVSGRGFLRNRKTGHTYEVGYRYYDFTDVLLKDLKQTFPDTNFIGFRIVPSRDFFICRRYTSKVTQISRKAVRTRVTISRNLVMSPCS